MIISAKKKFFLQLFLTPVHICWRIIACCTEIAFQTDHPSVIRMRQVNKFVDQKKADNKWLNTESDKRTSNNLKVLSGSHNIIIGLIEITLWNLQQLTKSANDFRSQLKGSLFVEFVIHVIGFVSFGAVSGYYTLMIKNIAGSVIF